MIDTKNMVIDMAGVANEISSLKNKKDAFVEEIKSLNSELNILYEKKKAIEAEMKQFSDTVRGICAATGKTKDEIEV